MKINEMLIVNNKCSLFILKDNFTPKEFVKKILTFTFDKNDEESDEILEKIWLTDKAYISSYIKEIALVKKTQVERNAKTYGFPLKVVLEDIQ